MIKKTSWPVTWCEDEAVVDGAPARFPRCTREGDEFQLGVAEFEILWNIKRDNK